MLIALWPLFFPRNNAHSGGTYVEPDITHRAIRGKETIQRTSAMIAAEAHLQRLQEVDHGAGFAGSVDGEVAVAGVSNSHQPIGNAPIRIPRHERALAGRIPEALGASLAAGDALRYVALDEAMKAYAAKQAADEDDALIIILGSLL